MSTELMSEEEFKLFLLRTVYLYFFTINIIFIIRKKFETISI